MKRVLKSTLGVACLAAIAIGQVPARYDQPQTDSRNPIYYVVPTPEATGVYQERYQPVEPPLSEPMEPQEPAPLTDQPSVVEPLAQPTEFVEPLPDTGPSLNDWQPAAPGELNPRTGLIEPDWSNMGTGVPDYSKPYDPKDDPEVQAEKEKKRKSHHDGWGGNWDSYCGGCPSHP